jgi:hypothetical protein
MPVGSEPEFLTRNANRPARDGRGRGERGNRLLGGTTAPLGYSSGAGEVRQGGCQSVGFVLCKFGCSGVAASRSRRAAARGGILMLAEIAMRQALARGQPRPDTGSAKEGEQKI